MTASLASSPLLGSQRPRIASWPDYAFSAGPVVGELAASTGLLLDDYQQFVIDHSLGESLLGKWAAFEIGIEIPRQNGKGGILEAVELAHLFIFGTQRICHSAHLAKTAKEAYARLKGRINKNPELRALVAKYRESNEECSITLVTGQKIDFVTRTGSGGRGLSASFGLDSGDLEATRSGLIIFDEAMYLDASMVDALIPTLTTIPNCQIWYLGSAGFPTSELQNRIHDRGHAGGAGLAYFEWSVDPNHRPPDPPIGAGITEEEELEFLRLVAPLIAEANPAYGTRIEDPLSLPPGEQCFLLMEMRSLTPAGWICERLGIREWQGKTSEPLLNVATWADLVDVDSDVANPVVFGLAVHPDRTWSTITVSGRQGRDDEDTEHEVLDDADLLAEADALYADLDVDEDLDEGDEPEEVWHLEVIDNEPGTAWVVARLVELTDSWEPAAVMVVGNGPAAALVEDLEAAGVPVDVLTAGQYAQACAGLADAISAGTVRHLGQAELDVAVASGQRQHRGDQFTWARNPQIDITPLEAATVALAGAKRHGRDLAGAVW